MPCPSARVNQLIGAPIDWARGMLSNGLLCRLTPGQGAVGIWRTARRVPVGRTEQEPVAKWRCSVAHKASQGPSSAAAVAAMGLCESVDTAPEMQAIDVLLRPPLPVVCVAIYGWVRVAQGGRESGDSVGECSRGCNPVAW